YDANVSAARAMLARTTDAEFMVQWTLKNGGRSMFSMPRVAVFRSFILNHAVHHRGQLSVYLRLLDVPIPNIYGPTADTQS
ncbi:MAG: DinB family protein, partial [Vicinamibacterales bacterium]